LLLESIGDEPVADICCADGDLAFFLESTGCRVHAFDWPVTSHNGMRGVRAVRDALPSRVEVFATDLDGQFTLPAEYKVVFLLGALYHLKNPFYVLEMISRHSQYCLLSTRIAARTPDGSNWIRDLPVAYLVSEDELNQDNTNYWIFSETGLRRLLTRTNWEVLEFMTTGARGESDPIHADERAFFLLRSRYGMSNVELGTGWHAPESTGWRWTERRFVAGTQSADRAFSSLKLRFYIPPVLIERWGSVEVRASVNGSPLPPEMYNSEGDFEYLRGFGACRTVSAEFQVDRALPPDDSDRRERGVIVAGLSFD
jgi:tRNA (mo5U34)-methyltransferase